MSTHTMEHFNRLTSLYAGIFLKTKHTPQKKKIDEANLLETFNAKVSFYRTRFLVNGCEKFYREGFTKPCVK